MAYPSILRIFLLAVATACSLVATAQAQALLDTSFSDGALGPQNLPSAGQWFYSAEGRLSATPGNLTMNTNNGSEFAMALVYFTDPGSGGAHNPILLDVGQQLTLSMTFTASGIDSTRGFFRFGLFNSNGNRYTDPDTGTGTGSTTNSNYRGYGSFYNIGTGTSQDGEPNGTGSISKRTGSANGLINVGSSWTGVAENSRLAMQNSTAYTATLAIARTAEGVIVTQSIVGGSLNYFHSGIDSENPFISFDTLAIATSSAFADTLDITSVNIALTQIPEASTTAATLAGVLLAGILLRHRLRRRA